MRDDQLRAIGERISVVCATFMPEFVSERMRRQLDDMQVSPFMAFGMLDTQNEGPLAEHAKGLGLPSFTEVVDHIDHIVDVAGIDHVGLGSE